MPSKSRTATLRRAPTPKAPSANHEPLITLKDAAKFFSKSTRTLEFWVSIEFCPFIAITPPGQRRTLRFRQSDLENWLLTSPNIKICTGRDNIVPVQDVSQELSRASQDVRQEASL